MEFKIKLLRKKAEALNTVTFYFERPGTFSYIAGQYVYLSLAHLDAPDPRGETRHFTLSSSPTEKDLSVTVRIRKESNYKNTLLDLSPGSTLSMRGPNGFFVLDEPLPTAPQVFIAGGIGITPYRSIIKWCVDTKASVPIHLLYSNSIPEEIAFQKEIDELVHSAQNVQATLVVTKPEESRLKWKGPVGRIDKKFLKSYLITHHLSLVTPVFWLCGPPPMVSALEDTLAALKVPENNIRVEKFTGY